MTTLNTINEIKSAVDAGHNVECEGGSMKVVKTEGGEYLVKATTGYCVGLTGAKGTKYETQLNAEGFYIA